ncbi:MAG: efflux RND transporter permease subunit [Bacteroidota bacterium]
MKKNKFREFFLSSWAIDNRTTIFLLTAVITLSGMLSYQFLPKENFPEIQWPVIMVSTPYPGTAAKDIENLVSRKIEKELKGIDGVKEINSTSIQDFSSVFVEFETNVDLDEAKRQVQEAVDRAKSDLPNDLPTDPIVVDIDLSEIPIMQLIVSGPFDNVSLKKYSEDIKDRIEELAEIRRVDIIGAPEREIKVDVDLFKLEAANLTMGDVEQAIAGENVIISGGDLDINKQKVSVRLNQEFKDISDLENLLVRSIRGNSAYIKDIATVEDGFKERASIARKDGLPVMTLNVIKKGGENLVDASIEIKSILEEMQAEEFPEALTILISNDQSELTFNMLDELINTIIIGFILVTLVLMFFMGLRDALFVGLAVPLSSFISFAVLYGMGYSMNLILLFAFILAMGIVVDNAIVVIENTYRIFMESDLPIKQAAKKAAGEVIAPVFSGTLTTVCPFLPLLFWAGPVGEFMGFLPVVMIITLFASLFVAYVINPVFAAAFMKKEDPNAAQTRTKRILIYSGITAVLGLLIHFTASEIFGNFLIFMAVFVLFNGFILRHAINWFQQKAIPSIKNAYRGLLRWSLDYPWAVIAGTFAVIFLTMVGVQMANIKFIQFPTTEPNFIYVYNELPLGTNIEETDSVTRILEDRVMEVVGQDNPIIKSVITNIAIGAGDANSFDQSSSAPNKGKITVEFVEFKKRNGESTLDYLGKIRENVKGIAGAKVVVGQDEGGPPGSAPIEVMVTSENFEEMMQVSEDLFAYLDSVNIAGIEKLKWDADDKRPEFLIDINRERARANGLSSGQIGMAIRTGLFGKEVSKFRDREDEYPIMLRLDEKYRDNISDLINMRVTFMDMATGRFRSIPISAVADVELSEEYGGINRTDLEKSVAITSNVLTEYNVEVVANETKYWVGEFLKQGRGSDEVDIKVGGQIEDMAEQSEFLGTAFGAAILLIFMILVTQFNSFSNVIIILSQVILSVVGVFIGHAVMGMDFSVVLSGVGIVVLAGIVVNNGIILLDFFNIMQKQGYNLKDSIIEGGAVRFTPVLLTATSTVLGLVPLALSFNINFESLLTRLDPQIYFGGFSAAFWQPFSWSIIFGLSFATIITLLVVPVIYYQIKRFEDWFGRKIGTRPAKEAAVIESDYSNGQDNGHSNGSAHYDDAYTDEDEEAPSPMEV